MTLYYISFFDCLSIFLVDVFVFKDTATTEIYTYGHTLSLHDALPISSVGTRSTNTLLSRATWFAASAVAGARATDRRTRAVRIGISIMRRDRKSTRLNSSH